MLSAQEILCLLKNIPEGYLDPSAPFLTRNILHPEPFKKSGAISSGENTDFLDTSAASHDEIFCNVMGCKAIFDNVTSYQSHYNMMHRFICSECKKSLPTDHFLDLHITEHHDSYFSARLARGDKMYKCYLEDCKETFLEQLERKEHCIKQHKFPSNFRYDKVQNHMKAKKKTQLFRSPSDESMEEAFETVNTDVAERNNQKLKTFSFGHQKEKTFRVRNGPKPKADIKTLENMQTLKEALETI